MQYDLLDYCENILEAWPKLPKNSPLLQWLRDNPDPKRLALCDSGVFSTWTLGEEVDIDAYAEFCHENIDIFSAMVGCDVIPGEFGRVPTAQEVDTSAAKGWENYLHMVEDLKLPAHRVIHVFHQGEEIKWLENLMKYNDDHIKAGGEALYIGLSPANDRTTKQKAMWLDQVMPYITNPDGSAKVRWHGFGVTAVDLLKRYPWFTIDSTSWMRAGAFGAVRVPLLSRKNPYLDSKLIVAVTEATGYSQGNKHYDKMCIQEQKVVCEYLESVGVTIEDVKKDEREGVQARQSANVQFWKRMEKELQTVDNRWKPPQPSFI